MSLFNNISIYTFICLIHVRYFNTEEMSQFLSESIYINIILLITKIRTGQIIYFQIFRFNFEK